MIEVIFLNRYIGQIHSENIHSELKFRYHSYESKSQEKWLTHFFTKIIGRCYHMKICGNISLLTTEALP